MEISVQICKNEEVQELVEIVSDLNYLQSVSDREEHEFFFHNLEMSSLELLYCGYQRCKPGHSYGPIMRDHFYYHYVVSGKGIYRKDNSDFEVTAGSGFIGLPNRVIYYEADKEDPWSYIWVGAKGSSLNALISRNGSMEAMPIIYHDKSDPTLPILNSIVSCAQDSSAASYLRAVGLFFLLFSELEGSSHDPVIKRRPRGTNTKEYVDKAIQFIWNNYYKRISMQTVADYIGIDADYLGRIFRKELNITPVEFLKNYRINLSYKLLLHTNMPVKEIAASVGFNDPQYFSRCFTQNRGLSPREIRKAAKT